MDKYKEGDILKFERGEIVIIITVNKNIPMGHTYYYYETIKSDFFMAGYKGYFVSESTTYLKAKKLDAEMAKVLYG